jgi:RNA polymerase sigma factor (sigma-70 family)
VNSDPRSERQLIADFYACEEEEAAERIFQVIEDRWWAEVWKYVDSKFYPHEDVNVEQLTEKVFTRLRCSKRPDRIPFDSSRGSFCQWLFMTARSVCANRRKQLPKRVPLPDQVSAPEHDASETALHDIKQCLESLTDQQKDFITLWERGLGKLSQTEIAEVFGVGSSRIAAIKKQALKRLKPCLKSKGYDG